jgi:hypothetical protein
MCSPASGPKKEKKKKDDEEELSATLCFVFILYNCVCQCEPTLLCVYSVEPVAAINNLYVALGNPVLPGWVAAGGDPCGEAWQGVVCNNTEIIRMYGNPFS